MMNPNQKILIVETETELLEGLCQKARLAKLEPMACQTFSEAVEHLRTQKFDLVVTDLKINQSEPVGIEILRMARDQQIPTILMSSHVGVDELKQAINLQAAYYIDKPVDFNLFENVLNHQTQKSDPDTVRIQAICSEFQLSPREREVFMLVCKGLNVTEIAEVTKVKHRTVRAHLSSIYKKTQVASRTELACLVFTYRPAKLAS